MRGFTSLIHAAIGTNSSCKIENNIEIITIKSNMKNKQISKEIGMASGNDLMVLQAAYKA